MIFLHLSKTGGNTLGKILKRQYSPNIYEIRKKEEDDSLECFLNMSQEKRNNIKLLLAGHMPLGLHKYFSSPTTYITLLRNPVEGIISQYHAIRFNPRRGFYEAMKEKNMTLKDYAESGLNGVNNFQVRLISGNYGSPREMSEPLPANALAVAKDNLQKYFKVVGLTEKFDETLLVAKRVLNWEKRVYYYRENVTKKRLDREKVTDEVMGAIKRNNQLDLKLYEFAKAILEKSIVDYGQCFENDLSRFKKVNNIYQAIDNTKKKIKRPIKLFMLKYATLKKLYYYLRR